MYSDRIATESQGSRKRSLKDRLGVGFEPATTSTATTSNSNPSSLFKRTRREDDKWKHDLYDDDDVDDRSTIITRNEQRSSQDLRLKLNKKVMKVSSSGTGRAAATVKDLREKLSGVQPTSQPGIATAAVTSYAQSAVKGDGMRRPVNGKQVAVKPIPMPKIPDGAAQKISGVDTKAPVGKPAMSEPMTIGSFLQSLGLSKYQITFQAEEIDMQVLRLMSDNELKDLGIPMGPRKKIILAMPSSSRR